MLKIAGYCSWSSKPLSVNARSWSYVWNRLVLEATYK